MEWSKTRKDLREASKAGLALLGLCLIAALAACNRSAHGLPAAGPNQVSVLTATPRDIAVTREYVAQTQSSRQVNIQARISGFLERRVYTEGALVKAGEVLFLLDKKPFEAQLDQARAALLQQQAVADNARANLDRIKPLVQQNALSPKDLDDANGQYQQAVAGVAQAKAQVVQAQLNLSYATITSPVSGMSGAAQQSDGTYISTSNSLLTTVSALSPMWVNFSVSESQYQEFRRDVATGKLKLTGPRDTLPVQVVLADGTVFPNEGHITFADPDYDTKTGTFLVRVSVETPQGGLRPNQFVRVRLLGAVRPNALAVPQRAVQQGPKGHFVWVVNNDSKAESRPVRVGEWYGDNWVIDEGLQAGDRVIVDGAVNLTAGAPVQVTQSLAADAQAGASSAAAAPK